MPPRRRVAFFHSAGDYSRNFGNLLVMKKSHRTNTVQTIERLLDESKWNQAISKLQIELQKQPGHHWFKARLGYAFCKTHRWLEAKRVLTSAHASNPKCPLVLWELGMLSLESNQPQDAIMWFKNILATDIDDLAFGECGEGMRPARSLSIDSKCGVGTAYTYLRNRRQAIMWYQKHLDSRTRGIFSVFDRREIKNELAILQNGDWPSDE